MLLSRTILLGITVAMDQDNSSVAKKRSSEALQMALAAAGPTRGVSQHVTQWLCDNFQSLNHLKAIGNQTIIEHIEA